MEVLDTTLPLQQRIRALHVIKDSIPKCDAAEQEKHLQLLIDAFPTTDSVLFKHEIAFTLGQIGDRRALPHLTRWLHDANEDPVTRHECAEAMGAIGDPSSVPELEKYRDQGPVELQETVHLALRRLEWLQKGGQQEVGEFMSVDPAPPATAGQSIAELQAMLLNEELDMFERYRAMFALRNLSTEESVLALCAGLRAPKSALFRHEIAYVLGQLEHPASVPALQECLTDTKEHAMVRHEAAEALGGMARDECLEALRTFKDDAEPLVGDSCVVGLDMHAYWSQWRAPEEATAH